MVKETANSRVGFLLATIIYFEHYYTRTAVGPGEGPTIEWSYLQRKIVREKRLSCRAHEDCILLC